MSGKGVVPRREIAEMDSVVTIGAAQASLQTLGLRVRIGSIFSSSSFSLPANAVT